MQAGATRVPPRRVVVGLGVAIGLLTLAVYAPVRRFEFVNFDDLEYVVGNPHVLDGPTPAGVRWAFTTSYKANWHPLTWLSHMLDCRLFGLAPGGHHLTSAGIHALSAVLLFAALRALTGAVWRSAVVALLFALHPLRVESVAWVSERKDVLSVLGAMATLAAYAGWVRHPTPGRYAAVVVAFVAGLLAKPMLVTLPAVLLLLDWWPLGRLRGAAAVRPCVVEKLPLLGVALAVGVVAVLAQRAGGALGSLGRTPFGTRVASATVAYVAYLGQTVWPLHLSAFYPYRNPVPASAVVGAVAVLGTVSAAVAAGARRAPWVVVGWLWYVGTLLPVSGLVKVGDVARADRFTYLPSVGLLIAVVWTVHAALRRARRGRWIGGIAATAALALCVATTTRQLQYWHDSLSLWQHALDVGPDNHVAHNNLGTALLAAGRTDEAVAHFEAVVRLRPDYAKGQVNLGTVLAMRGDREGALARYGEALRLDVDNAAAWFNQGRVLAELGRFPAAAASYREAVRCDPDDATARAELRAVEAQLEAAGARAGAP